MSSSRLVRGAKTRMFAIVCLICVLGAVVFVFHGTQSKLAEVQKLVNSCNQQQESLSAQLQVIFEYKVRLEKSLTKEKEDHKQTKETLETKLKEEKSNREKDVQEAKNKYEALLQQNKFLQNQLDDLKESEKKQEAKLSEENVLLQKEVDHLKKENSELNLQKEHDLEKIKTDYLEQQEKIRSLTKENENLNARFLPEKDQRNYFEKQSIQIKEELEKIKRQLSDCEELKNSKEKRDQLQPDTNVLAEMPKLVYGGQKLNGSTTPGLNPEAVNNFEVSSPKPQKDPEQPGKKMDEQVAQPPKKPTQESIVPLAQPRGFDNQVPQIPEPGNVNHDPLANTLQKPNTGNVGQEVEQDSLQVRPAFIAGQGDSVVADEPKLFAPAPLDHNRAEEEDNIQKQGEIPRIKNGENYHGADYERDQPEDEEDDEGEQMDYDNERSKKEQKNVIQQPLKMMPNHDGESVMVQPK